MSFYDSHKNYIHRLFPVDFIEKIINIPENAFIETLMYETSLGITKENVDDSILLISEIIHHDYYKRYILINCFEKRIHRKSKAIQKVIDTFQLNETSFNKSNTISIKHVVNTYISSFKSFIILNLMKD